MDKLIKLKTSHTIARLTHEKRKRKISDSDERITRNDGSEERETLEEINFVGNFTFSRHEKKNISRRQKIINPKKIPP